MAAVMSIFRAIALLGSVSALLATLPCPVVADLRGHGGMVRAIDFSPDGRRVLTGSFDFTAVLWDFEEQREIGRLGCHQEESGCGDSSGAASGWISEQ